MGKITGRSDDMLIIRGVNVFPTQIEEQILRDPQLTGNYQIQVSREGALDNVEVRCELTRDLSGRTSDEARTHIGAQLRQRIKTLVGISTQVHVLDCETLPRTLTGKAARVIDQRPRVVP